MRFIKNSSRLEVKIARNLTRSRSAVRSSIASASTRPLNASQLKSRSSHCGPLIFEAAFRSGGEVWSMDGCGVRPSA